MTGLFQIAGVIAGLWLVGLGVWMALRPRQALGVLAAMGGTPAVHFGEMAVRVLIGAALIGAAPPSHAPALLTVFGGFLIVSALALMLLPRRLHSAYSTWWAARIPAAAVRVIAPLSVAAGAALIWSLNPEWPTV
ncbi:hypothetical protein [Brevundimonas sp. FT23028]|uniref:hypothetical protein n=1 Tax=Brevundimonas sp. FT23028 TaxID=3393748 RepID=UPI003B586181